MPIPSQIQLNEILNQLITAKQDAQIELNVSGLLVRRFKQEVFICRTPQKKSTPLENVTLDITRILNSPSKVMITSLDPKIQLHIKLIVREKTKSDGVVAYGYLHRQKKSVFVLVFLGIIYAIRMIGINRDS